MKKGSLHNKTALVLGGTRGIGRAIAEHLAGAGATLIIPYYDWPQDSQRTSAWLAGLPQPHLALKIDLRDPAQVKTLTTSISDQFGALHILINNIERGGMPIVHGPCTPEQWELELDTTLSAKWLVFHAALPLLRKTGDAAVINISSIAGTIGRSGPAALMFSDGYSAANRAITSFTENWARLGAPEVRVNELRLGFIETRHAEKTRGWELLSPAQQQAIIARTLLKRTGRLTEVVKSVDYLIRAATYMTGSVLCLDGGYSLGHDSVPPLPPSQDNLEIKLASGAD